MSIYILCLIVCYKMICCASVDQVLKLHIYTLTSLSLAVGQTIFSQSLFQTVEYHLYFTDIFL